ncbi:MAG: MMPL family transporter [Candidatus Thermoplasmatota archaeon]|nr:MMPL family transporter [Candidatus Thermoplasmatota archaeon]
MNTRPLAKLLVERPRTVILVYTIITIIIGFQATNIYMESDLTTFLPEDDPTVQLWSKLDEEFQIGTTIIIYVEADDIRQPEVLREMDRVTSSPLVNKYEHDKGKHDGIYSVRSLAQYIKLENAKTPLPGNLGGEGIYRIPDDPNVISQYMSRLTIQQIKGTLFTNTYDVAVILLQLAEDADYETIQSNIERAIDQRGTFFSTMTVTGTIAMQNAIQRTTMQYFQIIFIIAITLVSLVLFIFHRTIKGIIIALFPTAYSIALTFGVLGAIQPQLTILSVSIVALLLGLGVDYSVHLMNRFAEEQHGDTIEKTAYILSSTGKAIMLSTITTMIGFGSLMISSMTPIVLFGFGCAIGIFFVFLSTIILTPSLSTLLRFKKDIQLVNWQKFSHFILSNKFRIIVIALFFAFMSLIVLPQTKTDTNYFDLAPQDIPELIKLIEYSENFGGANYNALMVETEPQGLTYPEVIDAIYGMQERMRDEGIELYSLIDGIKEASDILERNEIIYSLSQYIGIDEIIFDRIAQEGLVDEDFSKTLIVVYIPTGLSMSEIEEKVTTVNQIAAETIIPRNGKVSALTGQDAVNVAINRKLTDEQIRSMIIAILLVLAALILIFSSSIYGFLTMIPVFFVLMWEPGFLVIFDIPLNVITISIGSIMIGIGIDYGIHIMHRIHEEMNRGLVKPEAIKRAIERTGLSLVEAALTTIAGISSIFFIGIPALQEFALVIILMTGFSCIAAALILPAFFDSKIVKES